MPILTPGSRAKSRRRGCSLALLGLLSCSAAAQAGQRLTLDDLGRQVSLSQAVISPDGRQVAVVVSRQDSAANRHVRSLVVIDVTSGAQWQPAAEHREISAPKWSHRGDRLAWLSTTEAGVVQIHVKASRDSAAPVTRVTHEGGSIQSYDWSADDESFLFISSSSPVGAAETDLRLTSFDVADNDFLAARAPVPARLARVDIESGATFRLSTPAQNVKAMVVLPDQRFALFSSEPGTRRGGNIRATLHKVRLRDGEQQTVLDAEQLRSAPLQSLFAASPDGEFIAYSRSRGPEPFFRSNGLMILPSRGGEQRWLSAVVDRSFGQMAWLPDGKAIIAVAADRTRDAMWRIDLDGRATRLDPGGIRQVSSLSISRTGELVFIGAREQHPEEIYFLAAPSSQPRQLTQFNSVLAQRQLGRVTTLTWQVDGVEVAGVLTYPPDFQAGKKYPLVLDIHGGPMSTSSTAFHAFDQLLAAQGWLVFAPNYRGSTSAGDAFQRVIINDAGDGPARDVMAGIDAIKALGIVDEARIAVSGWSYGGFLTAWLTSHYSGWRAAVAAAAVTDWFDSYSFSDINEFFGFGLGGSPWREGAAVNYWRQSPMAYAHRIRTPTLILSTTGDARVPITQSYKLFRALQDNAVDVQFIAYAQGGHMPADPVNQRDWYRRWMEWIDARFNDSH